MANVNLMVIRILVQVERRPVVCRPASRTLAAPLPDAFSFKVKLSESTNRDRGGGNQTGPQKYLACKNFDIIFGTQKLWPQTLKFKDRDSKEAGVQAKSTANWPNHLVCR